MRLPKTKVLTGTMLTLLLSAVSVFPAIARPAEGESRQLLSQTNTDTTTPSPTDASQLVRGTVRSIKGNVVTLTLPDGTTRDMMLTPEDLTRLNLMPGMEISATLDDQNMASNVSMVTADTTDTTRLNRTRRVEETTTQQRTVQTTPSPAPTTITGETTTAPETTTTQTEPETTQAAPVPALW
ncbi:hypothetical protein [Coleofasciculus sp. FACHB-1120]|uniref:hypothetical protein n=1 Tax=Coleofasciculus sp. FACHB-1120 TaxID=2692783 RepID=UPI0016821AC3|nr:hypothetical protein [Coleofasciculus sp. FACHB-1120]MBD2742585.1 hypothetical protein [Coleofasciculus sp. FACHB-1120]